MLTRRIGLGKETKLVGEPVVVPASIGVEALVEVTQLAGVDIHRLVKSAAEHPSVADISGPLAVGGGDGVNTSEGIALGISKSLPRISDS